jgi:hypothetical protein
MSQGDMVHRECELSADHIGPQRSRLLSLFSAPPYGYHRMLMCILSFFPELVKRPNDRLSVSRMS